MSVFAFTLHNTQAWTSAAGISQDRPSPWMDRDITTHLSAQKLVQETSETKHVCFIIIWVTGKRSLSDRPNPNYQLMTWTTDDSTLQVKDILSSASHQPRFTSSSIRNPTNSPLREILRTSETHPVSGTIQNRLVSHSPVRQTGLVGCCQSELKARIEWPKLAVLRLNIAM
jgi:hypothetical protein